MAATAPGRKDVLWALGVTGAAMLVYRVGVHVPIPGLSLDVFGELLRPTGRGSLLGQVANADGLARLSVFSLGLTPYITAWIVMELWAVITGGRGALVRQSPAEQQTFERRARLFGLGFAALQGYGIATAFEDLKGIVPSPGFLFRLAATASLVAGLALLYWLADQITRHGLCNGIWLLVAADIISGLPRDVLILLQVDDTGAVPRSVTVALLISLTATVALVVCVERAVYRLPLSDGTSHPLRINLFGMLPAQYAYPVALLPLTLGAFLNDRWFARLIEYFAYGQPGQLVILALIIMLMTLFYTTISADPMRLASTLRKQGLAVPGVEPGETTAVHIGAVMNRIAALCALYFIVLMLVPIILGVRFSMPVAFSAIAVAIVALTALDVIDRFRLDRSYAAQDAISDAG